MLKMSDEKEKVFQGGAFLTENLTADDIITPEDFTEEHKMIAKTTEDFINKEVLPKVEKLENQEFELSVQLLKQAGELGDRKSTRLNSSHVAISYAVFCLKKK